MGASISYKLKNSTQGALAGGGDPATSPLYVFGPFLSLLVGAGAAEISYGASIWLAVLTVIAVASMYRYVMIWITDGSGGSGLSEEEFGGWAVKVNSAVTVIEYTLTFLVSVAALVTFIADRFAFLGGTFGGMDVRSILAVILTLTVGLAVNRGSKVSTRFFGPATALILGFLWLLNATVIVERGFKFPDFRPQAFSSEYLHFTLGGFARILALMTGIEIFANLVASYEGSARERSRKAFGSMLIVMGTTVATMLILGPAVLELSDPHDQSRSVFTQTMDALLPRWLSYIGTLIGVAVLLSAAAASAQGIQNLSLGLRARHYIPARWGRRNKYDVASTPAWAQAIVCSLTFALFGTHEETYLALYAAGVFVLLSMTGWSAARRFLRFCREKMNLENTIGLSLSTLAAICATFATVIIFEERFFDGAWTYCVTVPALYWGFTFFRRRLGAPPSDVGSRLTQVINAAPITLPVLTPAKDSPIAKILVPLNGTYTSEFALHAAQFLARRFNGKTHAVHFYDPKAGRWPGQQYADSLAESFGSDQVSVAAVATTDTAGNLTKLCETTDADLICISTRDLNFGSFGTSLMRRIIYATTPPILVFRPSDRFQSRSLTFPSILVPIDGSELAEQGLPFIASFAERFAARVTLLSVPEAQGDAELHRKFEKYLDTIRRKHFPDSISVTTRVFGSGPARTILEIASEKHFSLIALGSHGSGGVARQAFVKIGSVTATVLTETDLPVLFFSSR